MTYVCILGTGIETKILAILVMRQSVTISIKLVTKILVMELVEAQLVELVRTSMQHSKMLGMMSNPEARGGSAHKNQFEVLQNLTSSNPLDFSLLYSIFQINFIYKLYDIRTYNL
jgi:hypothetical protein